jgi:hypothetical protein
MNGNAWFSLSKRTMRGASTERNRHCRRIKEVIREQLIEPSEGGVGRDFLLFDLKKMSGLRESGQSFREALPAHNPDDTAMVEIFPTLTPPPNQPIKHEKMY